MLPRPGSIRAAFTLTEMLVVIGVIGLLLGLILPALAGIRAEAQSTQCLSNLRQNFVALDTFRQQSKDLYPYAAPIPPPTGQAIIAPGLPEVLKAVIPMESDTWFCPSDNAEDTQEIGTSYMYVPGGWMLLQPLLLPGPGEPMPSPQAQIERVRRLITNRYASGYLRHFPLISDIEENHTHGERNPRNAVFLDGNARIMKTGDDVVLNPDPEPNP